MAEPIDNNVFDRLRRSYWLALSLIALALLAEQFLVAGFLDKQADDAEIINVAGRQRMLSQRIAKHAILTNSTAVNTEGAEWMERHEWLKRALFDHPVSPHLYALDTTMQLLLAGTRDAAEGFSEGDVAAIDSLSDDFLVRMDAIVADVSITAAAKVESLQRTKRRLTLAALGILLLELLFIFRPLLAFVRRKLTELRDEQAAQTEARALAEEAVVARDESIRELRSLNQVIDQAALFATLRRDGSVRYLSRKFRELLGLEGPAEDRSLADLLHDQEGRRAAFADQIQAARTTARQAEWAIRDAGGEEHWLEVALIPARRRGSSTELFLLATDITDRKQALQALETMGQNQLAEEVERGKQRSLQIVEAQEKERLRIARDLHDGIGQKLTGLKFSLESIRPDDPEKAAAKLTALKELSKEIILSVRTATFNLSPPELTDYGLVVALEKMASELSRLTGQRIVFRNGGFTGRLTPTQEINLYRVIQEAVNNAVKYAGANYILVTLSAGPELLSITVDDDGQGFDADERRDEASGGGLGLASIEDRVADLDGRVFLRTHPETGTRITINVPV